MRVAGGLLTCPVCGKRMTSAVNMARHLILDQSRYFELHWAYVERVTGKSDLPSGKGGYRDLAEILEKRLGRNQRR